MQFPKDLSELLRPALPVMKFVPDEFDVEAADIIRPHQEYDKPDAILAGIPFDSSVMIRPGCRFGPDGVRQSLMFSTTYEYGLDVDLSEGLKIADIGNVDVVHTSVEETHRRVEALYTHLFSTGAFVQTIGGDHGLAYPLVKAAVNANPGKKLGMISFDAHLDVRHSHHGEVSSGTPFRRVLNIDGSPVSGQNIVYIGINTWHNSAYYAKYVKEQGITVFTARDIHRRGIYDVMDEAMEIVTKGVDGFYVTFDIDALDASVAPGTCSPSQGGLSAAQGLEGVWQATKHPKCLGADVMEVAPPLDIANLTTMMGAALTMQMLAGAQAQRKSR